VAIGSPLFSPRHGETGADTMTAIEMRDTRESGRVSHRDGFRSAFAMARSRLVTRRRGKAVCVIAPAHARIAMRYLAVSARVNRPREFLHLHVLSSLLVSPRLLRARACKPPSQAGKAGKAGWHSIFCSSQTRESNGEQRVLAAVLGEIVRRCIKSRVDTWAGLPPPLFALM